MHTPGPLQANCFLITAKNGREVTHTGLLGRRRSSHPGECGAKEDEGNARLIAAAYTSYDKHFGQSATEAAESDLLGGALELLGLYVAADDQFDLVSEDTFNRAKYLLALREVTPTPPITQEEPPCS